MLSAPVGLGPGGAQARGSEPGRLQASSKIVNSVVTHRFQQKPLTIDATEYICMRVGVGLRPGVREGQCWIGDNESKN